MRIVELVKTGVDMLKTAGIEEYRFEAEYLLACCLGTERIRILTDGDKEIDEASEKRYLKMIERRSEREPVAYIVGHREFMGLEFEVKRGVLIPRPDTETLVEEVISAAEIEKFSSSVEIGVGSGCISVSVAKYTGMRCFGTDISREAVEIAQKNAEDNGVSDRTAFFEGDMFEGIPDGRYDAVISNPPYIKKKDMDGLMADVRDYEPFTTLCGGEDGLDFYRKIASEGRKYLRSGGKIFFEIGYDEAEDVREILEKNGYAEIETIKDLSGLDRVVEARWRDMNV